MSKNRFKEYLKSRQWSDNLTCFVDHAQSDYGLPDAKSWDELEAYLDRRTVDPGLVKAAQYVWKCYAALPPDKAT